MTNEAVARRNKEKAAEAATKAEERQQKKNELYSNDSTPLPYTQLMLEVKEAKQKKAKAAQKKEKEEAAALRIEKKAKDQAAKKELEERKEVKMVLMEMVKDVEAKDKAAKKEKKEVKTVLMELVRDVEAKGKAAKKEQQKKKNNEEKRQRIEAHILPAPISAEAQTIWEDQEKNRDTLSRLPLLEFDMSLPPSATNLGLPEGDISPDEARALAVARLTELNKSKYYKNCAYTNNNTIELDYVTYWVQSLKEGGLGLPIIMGLCGTPSGVDLTKGGKNSCKKNHCKCTSKIGLDKLLQPLAGYVQTDPDPKAKVPSPVFNARLSDIICPLPPRVRGAGRVSCPTFTEVEAWIKAAEINILAWLCIVLRIPTIGIPVGGTSTGMKLLFEKLDKRNIAFIPSELLPHMSYFAGTGLVCEQLADGVQMLNDVFVSYIESQNLEIAAPKPPRLVDIFDVDAIRKRSNWLRIVTQIGKDRSRVIDSIKNKEKRTKEEEAMLQNWTLGQHSRKFSCPAVREIMVNIDQKKEDERTCEENEMLALYHRYESNKIGSSIVEVEELLEDADDSAEVEGE